MAQTHEQEQHGNTLAAAAVGAGAGAATFAGAAHLAASAKEAAVKEIQLNIPFESTAKVTENAAGLMGKAKDAMGKAGTKIGDIAKSSASSFKNADFKTKAAIIAATVAATAITAKVTHDMTRPHNSLGNPPDAELSGRVAGQGQNRER